MPVYRNFVINYHIYITYGINNVVSTSIYSIITTLIPTLHQRFPRIILALDVAGAERSCF